MFLKKLHIVHSEHLWKIKTSEVPRSSAFWSLSSSRLLIRTSPGSSPASLQAKQKLLTYTWPGNIRELANIIERTVVLDFSSLIDSEHLYLTSLPHIASKTPLIAKTPLPLGITLHEMEKRLIVETLELQHHNRTKTASLLGISVRTLRNKLHEYGACVEEWSFLKDVKLFVWILLRNNFSTNQVSVISSQASMT